MSAPWTQEFDFYMGTFHGVPFLESVDLRAIDHVPLPSHPLLIRVRVRMNRPLANGLRSPEETDALWEIQAHLDSSLGREIDAIFWGKTITDGWTFLSFQIPSGDEITSLPSSPSLVGYEIGVAIEDDPEWEAYRSAYPNEYQQHQMRNRQVQAALEENGDTLEKRRRIDHMAYFPSEEARSSAVRPLKKARFRIGRKLDGSDRDDRPRYGIEFHRTDACDGRTPDDVTAQILDCIEPSGGTYDGWGCAVTT